MYTSPANPAAFSGLTGFTKNNKKLNNISQIKNLEAYSLHKYRRKKFQRRKTIASEIDEFWQVDLIDLSKLAWHNKGLKFLLCIIDVLSRYAWVVPLSNKKADSCRDAFKKIFESKRIPKYIYSDWGNEFKGSCKELFKKYNVTHIDSNSANKASIVERFNRTLKEKMWRYFTHNNTKTYVDVLDDLVSNYNNSFHRSIKMKPIEVCEQNLETVKNTLYSENSELNDYIVDFKFKIGDYVRIPTDKTIFEKGYAPKWSKEIYIIYQLNPTDPSTYKIKSLENEEFDWNFYLEELQKVSQTEFPFDTFKVIKKLKNGVLVEQLNSELSEPIIIENE